MSENQTPNNVIQFPQREAAVEPVNTKNKMHFRDLWDRLTPRGKKVAKGVGAAGALLSASTLIAATGPEAPVEPGPAVHDIKIGEDKAVTDLGIETDNKENFVTYTVKPGDSVGEIVSNVYGADDGENIYNNAHYDEEVAAVQDIIGDQLLQPGQELQLPANFDAPTKTGE